MNNREVDYDSIAESYDQRYLHEDVSESGAFLLDFVHGANRVLEVGCGTGHWLELLAERVPLVAGIDPSLGMLRQAHLGVQNTLLIRGKAESLPFRSQSFDRIFCINAFHHFSDKIAFVSEARRVLGPNGAFLTVALDPHTGWDRWWVYDYFDQTLEIDKQRCPPTSEIRAWMERAGFRNGATQEVQHHSEEMTAESAEQAGLLEPGWTSQLAVLERDEFDHGIELIRSQMDATRDRGEELLLATDLRLYGTIGWSE